MTVHEAQAPCPEPWCVSSTAAPEATGWTLIDDLWWCPLHALGEQRRLKRQHDEIDWYDGNIRVREQVIADHDADKESVRAVAKRAGLNRRDPEVRRKLDRIDNRTDRAREELTILERNRDNATARHELENERNTENPQRTDDNSEN